MDIPLPVSLYCRNDTSQIPRTLTLFKAGILHDFAECYVTTAALQTLPELHGTSQAELGITKFYLPNNITEATAYELQQLQDITPTGARQLDDMHARMFTLQQTFDVDSLLHVHHSSLVQANRTNWLATTLSTVSAVVIVGILCRILYLRFCNMPCAVSKPNTRTDATACPLGTVGHKDAETLPRFVFASYST